MKPIVKAVTKAIKDAEWLEKSKHAHKFKYPGDAWRHSLPSGYHHAFRANLKVSER